MRTRPHVYLLLCLILPLAGASACRHSVPVQTTPELRDAPPRESIVLLMPYVESDVVRLLRRTFVQAGLLSATQDPADRSLRVDLGAEWSDVAELREWQMNIRFIAAPWGGTLLSIRATELRTLYFMEDNDVQPLNSYSRVSTVSNKSRGPARDAWRNLEDIASALVKAGGAPLPSPARFAGRAAP